MMEKSASDTGSERSKPFLSPSLELLELQEFVLCSFLMENSHDQSPTATREESHHPFQQDDSDSCKFQPLLLQHFLPSSSLLKSNSHHFFPHQRKICPYLQHQKGSPQCIFLPPQPICRCFSFKTRKKKEKKHVRSILIVF